jgi:hypothetical protein
VEVEWLILADSAQVVANKLYLLGGGWDRLTVNSGFPYTQPSAIALSVRVPWNETNQKHGFELEVASEDPASEVPKTLGKVTGDFEVGRPPGIPPGANQRVQLAVGFALKIEGPGSYVIVARIEGQELQRTGFNVVSGPMLQARRQSGQQD